MVTEAKKRANQKYDANHTQQVKLKLNTKTDADLLNKLKQVETVQGYIKRLIREDLAKG